MDRRQQVLRWGPSPLVQQPFQNRGVKGALGGSDTYFAVAGPVAGRVVGWRVRLDAGGNRLNKSRANLYDSSAGLAP